MNDDTRFLKIASQWLIAIMLTLALIAAFLLVTAVQVTSEETGRRILRRGVGITTDLDAILPQVESELHIAAESGSEAEVQVPGFPIPIDLPRVQAATIGGPELRKLILDESALRLYDDGTSVWSSGDETAEQNIATVSTAGALHRGFGFITNTWHNVFLGLAVGMGIIVLFLAATLAISLRSYMRLISLGAVTATAAIISLAAAVGVRFALRTAETEADPFERALIDLGVDTVWIFVRNYLILSTLGFVVVGIAAVALWLHSRTVPSRQVSYPDTTP